MAEVNLVQAVSLALARAMAEDGRVIVLGEDVGVDGGAAASAEPGCGANSRI